MPSKPHFFLLTVLGLSLSQAFAQTPNTLKDAVEKAVLQNPEVTLKYKNLRGTKF